MNKILNISELSLEALCRLRQMVFWQWLCWGHFNSYHKLSPRDMVWWCWVDGWTWWTQRSFPTL